MSSIAQRIVAELIGRPLEQIAEYCQEYCSAELIKINIGNKYWEYFVLTDKSAIAINWSGYELQIKSREEFKDDQQKNDLRAQAETTSTQIPVDLLPAAVVRERLLKEIESTKGTLIETWKWTGRTREIILRVDKHEENLARTTYPSNSGRKPTGLTGMKTGGRKYYACLQLIAKIQSSAAKYN